VSNKSRRKGAVEEKALGLVGYELVIDSTLLPNPYFKGAPEQGHLHSGSLRAAGGDGGSTNTSTIMTEVPCIRWFCPDTSSLKRSSDSVAGAR
jgi:hypothetical protein